MTAIRPSRMPTSPLYQGDPVPSTIWPLAIITSNGADDAEGAAPAPLTVAASTGVPSRQTLKAASRRRTFDMVIPKALLKAVALGPDRTGCRARGPRHAAA